MPKVMCNICKHNNARELLVCENCGYPVNVKKFSELTGKDYYISLASLIRTWPKRPFFLNGTDKSEGMLNRFLTVYYLRPENAVNRAIEASIISNMNLWKEPALDIGCGDGIFSSVLRGGVFRKEYDTFSETDLTKQDIYDCFKGKCDFNDYFKKMPEKVHAGLDIKESIVKKAESIGAYEKTFTGSADSLPFGDGSFSTVFSNVFKNVGEVEKAFSEAYRVLCPGGKAIFVVSSHRYRDFLYYYPMSKKTESYEKKKKLLEMDRGRAMYNVHCCDISEWRRMIEKSGFKFEKYVSYLTEPTMRFWDTGLRNFSMKTIKFMNRLESLGMKPMVKKLVVSYLNHKLRIFTNREIENATPDNEGAYYIIAAVKT
ncbi:MAG: class I SAM-dependent methyltransferase [Candidatus Omnitrophota bacterium]